MDLEKSLVNIFEQKGIFLSVDEKDDELDMDSIQFISIIVEIESVFEISIEDDDLLQSKFKTFRDFYEMIYLLKNSNTTYEKNDL